MRARALGLSARTAETCARDGLDPALVAAVRRRMRLRSAPEPLEGSTMPGERRKLRTLSRHQHVATRVVSLPHGAGGSAVRYAYCACGRQLGRA